MQSLISIGIVAVKALTLCSLARSGHQNAGEAAAEEDEFAAVSSHY
jgi:hypothetical protein